MNRNRYLTNCHCCGGATSKAYAKTHDGKCKACTTSTDTRPEHSTRNERILDCGYEAYAREEGHYDCGDY
jgi:hypothetical protein